MQDERPHARTCGAKTRKGTPCRNTAVMENGRCRMHGGKSPIGAGHPSYRDGRHSKFGAIFSGDALAHYEATRDDPRYLEMREDIALMDTLLLEELMRARVGEGGALWEELGRVWRSFEEADPTKDATTAGRALRRMGEIIAEGAGRHAAQGQALEIIERKRKLTETERRRISEEQQMIPAARVLAFVGALVAIVNEETPERDARARIASKVARLVHQDVSAGGGGAVAAVGGG